MASYFDDVISFGLPAEIQQTRPIGGIVDFLSVHGNLPLPGCNRPYNGHITLFTTTIRPGQTVRQRLLVGKSEPPVRVKQNNDTIKK